ncbi:uncharacterized protein LOC132759769 [Ruditapes philippinarum]|uniref:uncharacterized protein LOC132759769 n=1 Tax=Ruditapes philippinarum TaxID=129788 RepID=UPI00295BC803|nr:uncharacterized protein LOC132759769 [Ruditapes philippinarum]
MACQAKNATLVEILDESPIFIPSDGTFWIGLSSKNDEGEFIWNSGQPLTFSNWVNGSPSGSNNEDCVTLFSNETVSGWKDFTCQSTVRYICERELIEISLPTSPEVCLWLRQENTSVHVTNWTLLNMGNFTDSLPASIWENNTCPSSNFYICENNAHGCYFPNICDVNAECVSVNGNYTCICNTGYKGDGNICTDIDECADGDHNCSPDAKCDNTPGSFTCTCNWGYNGNGVSCISQLRYRCNPDNSINLFYLPEDSYLFAMQVVENGNDIPCTVHDENATTVTLTGCSKDEEIIVTYGSYSGVVTYKVHGGRNLVILKLICLEISDEGVIHSVNSSFSTQLGIDDDIKIDPTYSVKSLLSAASTTVGKEITWTILFPEHYSLEVSSCTAYPGNDDSSSDYVSLISNGGCAVINDLISHFDIYSNGTASARLNAFKFYGYESVFLKCSLKICPSETTPTACMTTCSREKRSVQMRASRRPRSVLPVTISNLLYVTEVSLTSPQ